MNNNKQTKIKKTQLKRKNCIEKAFREKQNKSNFKRKKNTSFFPNL